MNESARQLLFYLTDCITAYSKECLEGKGEQLKAIPAILLMRKVVAMAFVNQYSLLAGMC